VLDELAQAGFHVRRGKVYLSGAERIYDFVMGGAARLTEMAEGVSHVYYHVIFDGRSTEPGSAPSLLRALEEKLRAIGRGVIVDGVGRGIALDRDGNYAKVKKAYDCMTIGGGTRYRG